MKGQGIADNHLVEALRYVEEDESLFHLNLGHAARSLNQPASALRQYIIAREKSGESGDVNANSNAELAIAEILTLHPHLEQPEVVIRQFEKTESGVTSFVRKIIENTAAKVISGILFGVVAAWILI